MPDLRLMRSSFCTPMQALAPPHAAKSFLPFHVSGFSWCGAAWVKVANSRTTATVSSSSDAALRLACSTVTMVVGVCLPIGVRKRYRSWSSVARILQAHAVVSIVCVLGLSECLAWSLSVGLGESLGERRLNKGVGRVTL